MPSDQQLPRHLDAAAVRFVELADTIPLKGADSDFDDALVANVRCHPRRTEPSNRYPAQQRLREGHPVATMLTLPMYVFVAILGSRAVSRLDQSAKVLK